MADDLVRDERVEMRVGNDDDFAVGRSEHGGRGKLARLGGKVDTKFRQRSIRHQLATPSVAQAFEPALLSDRVVAFLVTVADLRDDVAVALRKCVCLRDDGTRGIDKNFAAQLGHRGDALVGDCVAKCGDLVRCVERDSLELVGREREWIAAKARVDVVANYFARWNWRDQKPLRRVAEVSDDLGFFAGVETRAVISLVEPAPQFCYELSRPARERAYLGASLPVTNRTRPVGDMSRDRVCRTLALGAVARFTIHGGAGTIENDFEAKIGVHDSALRARESRKDPLALAAQVLDRFEQVAAPDQVSRI